MAIESVAEAWPEGFGPKAMAYQDSSVYMAWVRSIGDLMLNATGDALPAGTTSNLGGLILALAEAASELEERDRARWRAEVRK